MGTSEDLMVEALPAFSADAAGIFRGMMKIAQTARTSKNAEIKIATTALLQSEYKEDIDKKSKRTEFVKLNWYSGEETTIQIYSESARRFVTCWIDFRKNEVINYNNLNYTIKELIAIAKPEVVLFFYKSGELYFDGDQERIYRKQAIEEWCKQNAK